MSVSSLLAWAEGLPDSIPIRMETDSSRDEAIVDLLEQFPDVCGTPVAALMWLRIGRFEPSHEIVQDASSGIQAYIHGMLHRIEGDYWNANYWFRQVRNEAFVESIQRYLTKHQAPPPWGKEFNPSEFTKAIESLQSTRRDHDAKSLDVLQQVAMLEWQAVWEKALKSVFFTSHDH